MASKLDQLKALQVEDVPEQQPLTPVDRLVAQVFFDTQPTRRAEYFKQKGYELDPENSNRLKPIGAPISKDKKDEYYIQIDPGGLFNVKQYWPKSAGGQAKDTVSAASEFTTDLNEGLIDFIQGAVTQAVGVAGGVVGAPVGPIGIGTGIGGGRVFAYETLESLKDVLGDFFLDKNIPADQTLRAMQAGIQAVAPEIIKAGVSKSLGIAKGTLKAVQVGFRNLLNIGGGKVDDIAIKGLVQDPHTFADMNKLEQGGKAVQGTIDIITGKTDQSIPSKFNELGEGSILKQKMNGLNQQRTSAVANLTGMSGSNVSTNEALAPLQAQIDELVSKRTLDGNEKIALKYLQDKIAEIGAKGNTPFTFQEADKFIQDLQSDAYNGVGQYKNILKKVQYGVNEGLKGFADQLDQQLINQGKAPTGYSEIKGQQSKIFNAFEKFSDNVTRNNVMRTIISGELGSQSLGTPTGVQARGVGEAFQALDDAIGSNLVNDVRTGQIHNHLYQAMKQSKLPRGSGGFLTSAATVGGGTYLATRNPTMSAVAGLAAGIGSQPGVGLKAIGSAGRGIENLSSIQNYLTNEATPVINSIIEGVNKTPIAEKLEQLPSRIQQAIETPQERKLRMLRELPSE